MQPLLNALDREIEAVAALHAKLNAEAQVLATDAGALEAMAKGKLQLAQQLEQLDRERMELAAGLGCGGASPADWQAFLQRTDDPALSNRWQQLQHALIQSREANLHNGTLLAHLQHQVRTALGILHGQTLAPNLYGADGNRTTAPGSRTLATA